MPEPHIVLIALLATGLVALLGVFAFLVLVVSKRRLIESHQRTLEAERQLRRSQESFTHNAHHELRTPLQILGGYLQMLADLEPGPAQQAVLAEAQAATGRLRTIVQGLLDLSSLHQGTLMLHVEPAFLSPHLESLANCFQVGAESKGLRFVKDLPDLTRPLLCDAPRLCQALEALLENALGFSDRGCLSFRLRPQQEGVHWRLRFEVEDEGPGVPAEWGRLLRPFEQVESGLQRQHGGLGLGLPLAHGLATCMGGQLGLQPKPGGGTLAWLEVRFPQAETR